MPGEWGTIESDSAIMLAALSFALLSGSEVHWKLDGLTLFVSDQRLPMGLFPREGLFLHVASLLSDVARLGR